MNAEKSFVALEKYKEWRRTGIGEQPNLYGANLSGASLYGADLRSANLSGAKFPSPTMLLLASWGEVSDQLCIDLMRYDASNHPNPTKFDEWVKTFNCPYYSCTWQRAANFVEKMELWSAGPAPTALELATRLISEKCKQ